MDTMFRERVLAGAERFLERRGYELLDVEGDEFDFVAWDEDTLVLVDVRGKWIEKGSETFPPVDFKREDFEKRMLLMVSRNMDALGTDFSVRCDIIDIAAFRDSRVAAIRHLKGAASVNGI